MKNGSESALRVRVARERDALAMLAIYAPLVRSTAISFEAMPPTLAEYRRRIRSGRRQFPWLVCVTTSPGSERGTVLGYAYASSFRSRDAYRFTAEVTIYVAEYGRRAGVATATYGALFRVLTHLGYRTAVAVIALPNDPSVALHRRLGFEPTGSVRAAGFKHGRFHDISFWCRRLRRADPDASDAPVPFLQACDDTVRRLIENEPAG